MITIDKIKQILTSDYTIIGFAIVIGAVVYFKGLPLVGGIALGVAGTKLWDTLRKQNKRTYKILIGGIVFLYLL